jgi:hypothetical protein
MEKTLPPLLTTGARAETPYTFHRLLLKIWSVEELCYLFKTNPFILDSSIIDRKLITWLETSCDLPELAHDLTSLLKKNPTAEDFVMMIINNTCYLTTEETNRIAEILNGNIGLSEYEKAINRADFLLGNGKYQLARREYDRLLLTIPSGERVISGRIHHNRGVALARMFMFEQAALSFLSAYELNSSPESGRAYLSCIRLDLDEAEYIKFIAEKPAFRDFSLEVEHIYKEALNDYNETDIKHALDELILDKAMGNGNSYYSGVEQKIAAMKQEYRTATM